MKQPLLTGCSGPSMMTRDEIRAGLTALAERMDTSTRARCAVCDFKWCGLGEDRNGPCSPIRSIPVC